jgi:hypothetical protein
MTRGDYNRCLCPHRQQQYLAVCEDTDCGFIKNLRLLFPNKTSLTQIIPVNIYSYEKENFEHDIAGSSMCYVSHQLRATKTRGSAAATGSAGALILSELRFIGLKNFRIFG